MSNEITDEMLERTHAAGCEGCKINEIKGDVSCCTFLADALKSERAARKNNPGVWDGAPENARYVTVEWFEDSGIDRPVLNRTYYGRTLPVSPAREIAEEYASIWYDKTIESVVHNNTANLIESAINEYANRIKETK